MGICATRTVRTNRWAIPPPFGSAQSKKEIYGFPILMAEDSSGDLNRSERWVINARQHFQALQIRKSARSQEFVLKREPVRLFIAHGR